MTDHPNSSTDSDGVEKSASKNDPPEVRSGSLADYGVSPTNLTVTLSNSDGSVSRADQSLFVTDSCEPPTDQTVSPAHCSAPPTDKTVSLTDSNVSTTYQTLFPIRCGVSPTEQTLSLADCGAPPSDQVMSDSGSIVSDSVISAYTTDCENASHSTAEINAIGHFLPEELNNINPKPNFQEQSLNVQTAE